MAVCACRSVRDTFLMSQVILLCVCVCALCYFLVGCMMICECRCVKETFLMSQVILVCVCDWCYYFVCYVAICECRCVKETFLMIQAYIHIHMDTYIHIHMSYRWTSYIPRVRCMSRHDHANRQHITSTTMPYTHTYLHTFTHIFYRWMSYTSCTTHVAT